jgi:hypothetical protein
MAALMEFEKFSKMTVQEVRAKVGRSSLKVLIKNTGEFYYDLFRYGLWRPDFKDKLSILVEHGLDLNQPICERWDEKITPIFQVLSSSGREVASAIKALVEFGADINLPNKDGRTAIMVASTGQYRGDLSKPSVVKALIKAGADLCLKDSDGKLVTDLADYKALPSLVSAGAPVNSKSKIALMKAVSANDLGLTQDFLQRGLKAKIKEPDLQRNLPFLETIAQTYPDLFQKGFSLEGSEAQPADKKAAKAFKSLLDMCSAEPKNNSINVADEGVLPPSLHPGAWPRGAETATPHVKVVMPPDLRHTPSFSPPKVFDERMRSLHDQFLAEISSWETSEQKYHKKEKEKDILKICKKHKSKKGGLYGWDVYQNRFDIDDFIVCSDIIILQFWNDCFDIFANLIHSYSKKLDDKTKFDLALYRLRGDAFHGIRQGHDFAIHCLSYFDTFELAPVMARSLGRMPAQTWFKRFPDTGITGLLACAFSDIESDRSDAQQALRWLSAQGFREEVEEKAKRYGTEAHAVAVTFLDRSDEADFLPKKLAKLPKYFVVSAHPAPILKESGKALPAHAVETLCRMMLASSCNLPTPALIKVIEFCDPRSLADFALSAYDSWSKNGSKKEGIGFLHALGYVGDDRAAGLLIKTYRNSPFYPATAAAIAVLGAMGTNIAISGLLTIIRLSRYEKAQAYAQEVLENIAEARDLTPEMLEDLAVPDLGLDANSQMSLDFGPRRFLVALDANLDAVLTDEVGNVLKALPKAGKSDNAQLAKASTAQWKEFKAALKGQSSDQKKRFEQAMLSRREWVGATFKEIMAVHPLLSKMVRNLVWATLRDQDIDTIFRINGEGLYVSEDGSELSLLNDAKVILPHPLLLGDRVENWLQIFADNKLAQPFPQLARKWFAQGPETERLISRRDGVRVPLGSLRGLKEKGWDFGEGSAGMIWSVFKRTDEAYASIDVEPGWSLSGYHHDNFGGDQAVKLEISGDDPIIYSEMVRDFLSLPIAES